MQVRSHKAFNGGNTSSCGVGQRPAFRPCCFLRGPAACVARCAACFAGRAFFRAGAWVRMHCLCRLACGLYSGPARLEAVCPALLCVGLPRAFLLERARQRAVLSAGCVPPCFSSRCARLPTSTRAGIRRSISLPPAAASRPHASVLPSSRSPVLSSGAVCSAPPIPFCAACSNCSFPFSLAASKPFFAISFGA